MKNYRLSLPATDLQFTSWSTASWVARTTFKEGVTLKSLLMTTSGFKTKYFSQKSYSRWCPSTAVQWVSGAPSPTLRLCKCDWLRSTRLWMYRSWSTKNVFLFTPRWVNRTFFSTNLKAISTCFPSNCTRRLFPNKNLTSWILLWKPIAGCLQD